MCNQPAHLFSSDSIFEANFRSYVGSFINVNDGIFFQEVLKTADGRVLFWPNPRSHNAFSFFCFLDRCFLPSKFVGWNSAKHFCGEILGAVPAWPNLIQVISIKLLYTQTSDHYLLLVTFYLMFLHSLFNLKQ